MDMLARMRKLRDEMLEHAEMWREHADLDPAYTGKAHAYTAAADLLTEAIEEVEGGYNGIVEVLHKTYKELLTYKTDAEKMFQTWRSNRFMHRKYEGAAFAYLVAVSGVAGLLEEAKKSQTKTS